MLMNALEMPVSNDLIMKMVNFNSKTTSFRSLLYFTRQEWIDMENAAKARSLIDIAAVSTLKKAVEIVPLLVNRHDLPLAAAEVLNRNVIGGSDLISRCSSLLFLTFSLFCFCSKTDQLALRL